MIGGAPYRHPWHHYPLRKVMALSNVRTWQLAGRVESCDQFHKPLAFVSISMWPTMLGQLH